MTESEARRLEQLWSGEFGNAYVERNSEAGPGRGAFWHDVLDELGVRSVLEVGCNVGPNLGWLGELVDPASIYAVDVNERALEVARSRYPRVNFVRASARSLPFRDRMFDLAFATGVLIHLPPEAVPVAMSEIVRCSNRYVVCGEYYAPQLEEVPYRGESGALFKQDFGALYQSLFPELELRSQGLLGRDEGWDDTTWWLLERR